MILILQHFFIHRYISPVEACWHIFGFKMCGKSHTVERLPIHLEDRQSCVFSEEDDMLQVLDRNRETKLTQFFELCCSDEFARTLIYSELPRFYCWKSRQKVWERRQRQAKTIGRLPMVSWRGSIESVTPFSKSSVCL